MESAQGSAILLNGTLKDTALNPASMDTASPSPSLSSSSSTPSSPLFGMVYYSIVDASDIKVGNI